MIEQNLPSKRHLFYLAVILTLLFTYSGVSISFWAAIRHLDFLLNMALNFIIISVLLHLTYHLHFKWRLHWLLCLIIGGSIFLTQEIIMCNLVGYDENDLTEMKSITIPFGSMILLTLNVVYNYFRQQDNLNNKTPTVSHSSKIWIRTPVRDMQVEPELILYAILGNSGLEIETRSLGIIRSLGSLKQLESSLDSSGLFFRMNKQCLISRDAITSYQSLPDSRIDVELINGERYLVSKNKASSFRKWIASYDNRASS